MKRLRLSDRAVITPSPRRMSSRQSSGNVSRASRVSRLPAIDLMGVSELFSSCPSTRTRRCQACNSCSRERLGEVRDHHQLERQPALANARPPHAPAPRAARKGALEGALRGAFQAGGQAQIFRRLAQQALLRGRQQALPGAVEQA